MAKTKVTEIDIEHSFTERIEFRDNPKVKIIIDELAEEQNVKPSVILRRITRNGLKSYSRIKV